MGDGPRCCGQHGETGCCQAWAKVPTRSGRLGKRQISVNAEPPESGGHGRSSPGSRSPSAAPRRRSFVTNGIHPMGWIPTVTAQVVPRKVPCGRARGGEADFSAANSPSVRPAEANLGTEGVYLGSYFRPATVFPRFRHCHLSRHFARQRRSRSRGQFRRAVSAGGPSRAGCGRALVSARRGGLG